MTIPEPKLVIEPKSKVLVSDVRVIFMDLYDYHDEYAQARRGRYVVNLIYGTPMEALLLDDDDNIIDGFVGHSMPFLPWKGIPFIVHLGGEAEEVDPEFMDKHIWKYP